MEMSILHLQYMHIFLIGGSILLLLLFLLLRALANRFLFLFSGGQLTLY